MLSSISSSKVDVRKQTTVRTICLVLIGIVLMGLVAETAARFALHRVSRIEGRIDGEYRQAAALPAYTPSSQPTMLLLGNSILLEAIDLPSLQKSMSTRYDVHRLVIEQTEYLDLYYILRTLFRSGARPHEVVLCLGVPHLVGEGVRGEFTARFIDAPDLAKFARREHLDATTTSNYFFAHWSGWFGTRTELRKVLLSRMMPDMGSLATVLGWRVAPHLSEEEIRLKAGPRLQELKALCDAYGSQLTIVIPPTLGTDHAEVVSELGRENGIRVLNPVKAGVMTQSQFRDGFHLTPAAAEIFTAQLVSQL
jgi:hypothetical protein